MNKHLTHSVRTSLLHAKCKWPSIITSALWPFCYKATKEQHNKIGVDAEGWSPLERLLGYKDEIAAEDFHIWGCPVYVLDNSLQIGTEIGLPTWDPDPELRATYEAFTLASMWYEGEVAHTDEQNDTPISTDSKIDISVLGLKRSQCIKDLKKAELDTPTTSNEAGFILHTVEICLHTQPDTKDFEAEMFI
eukprot:8173499-Ditylum_brightwellii.AAC.1